MGGSGWLGYLRTCGPAVVLSEYKATRHLQRQHAPSELPTPVGDIRKDARNSSFLLVKLIQENPVELRYHLHHIAPARYATYRLGSTLPHYSTQLIKVLLALHPRKEWGDRQVVFSVGLLV